MNKHRTDDLIYLLRPNYQVAIHDTLGGKLVCLFDENPKRLIEEFIKVLKEEQEAIVTNFLKQHPYPSDFQMLSGEVRK